MNTTGPWSTEDFAQMSWHDVHAHGLALENFNSEDGSADLVLDIDFITEWLPDVPGYKFNVCRAELRFERVFGLNLTLDYKGPSAGMCPFSIAEIERDEVTYPNGSRSFKWRLNLNWPSGSIQFEAPAFKQRLVGNPRLQSQQWLSPEHRTRIDA